MSATEKEKDTMPTAPKKKSVRTNHGDQAAVPLNLKDFAAIDRLGAGGAPGIRLADAGPGGGFVPAQLREGVGFRLRFDQPVLHARKLV